MSKKPSTKIPWRPFTTNCCTVEGQTVLGNLSRCRPTRNNVSAAVELPSFRRLSFSDLSSTSSTRINNNEDVLSQQHPFGNNSNLFSFQLSELRAITQNFSSSYLLGEGGFGTVHKGYMDDSLRQGLKAYHYSFSPLCSVLSVNYLDRFLSSFQFSERQALDDSTCCCCLFIFSC
ncbi:hypothetical protein ACHQM5_015242 [Ranunculus cassubicifolius]